jgi:peptide-methionine (S)-S-oxide reductase
MTKIIPGALMLLMSFAAPGCGGDLPQAKEMIPPTSQPAQSQTAVFAGGCFWCTEAVFEQLKGVSDVTSGYAGDTKETANYETVCSGATNHAEAIRITYDPSKITFGQLLRVFFTTHDPTTKDQQGPDHGRQYRSAIFYANDQEKAEAQAYIKQLNDGKYFTAPVVTTIEPLTEFYPAETYHQDYVQRNPNQPYIVHQAIPKVCKVREKFADQVKELP